jgi:hypothetical protein
MNLPFPNLNDYIALFSLTEAKLPDCPLSDRNRDVFVSANGQRVARRNYFGARQAASPRSLTPLI